MVKKLHIRLWYSVHPSLRQRRTFILISRSWHWNWMHQSSQRYPSIRWYSGATSLSTFRPDSPKIQDEKNAKTILKGHAQGRAQRTRLERACPARSSRSSKAPSAIRSRVLARPAAQQSDMTIPGSAPQTDVMHVETASSRGPTAAALLPPARRQCHCPRCHPISRNDCHCLRIVDSGIFRLLRRRSKPCWARGVLLATVCRIADVLRCVTR